MIPRSSYLILLIDDEEPGLQLRKRVLESKGFQVLSASNPDAAMDLFRRNDVSIVVTDHLLGRATAAGLATGMKRMKPFVPIVSLSGTTNVDEALRYADKFVGKADGPDALLHMLDTLLENRVTARVEVRTESTSVPPQDSFELQSLLAAIIEDSSDAILSKTLDGRVMSWNHAAELMYGYRKEEMIGRSITKLLPSDRPDEITHILSRIKQGERISHFETARMAKNGNRLEVSLTISPIRNGAGELIGASTIARDITEQKKAEEALRRAEKLAVAGRMLATVAHEINNPLEAIGNIFYLLKMRAELSPEAVQLIEGAQEELKRVSEITTLTLGMQRGSSDRRESVNLTRLLNGVLTLYERRTKTLGVSVVREYETEEQIVGSPGELRQVFSNLIVNAMDALSKSGNKIVLRIRNSFRWDTQQRGLRISILDNGPGIPLEFRGKLFQPFFTSKGEQGTGIGLWVSRNIVKNHGGTLRMHSSVTPDRSGTCFSVFLPFQTGRNDL